MDKCLFIDVFQKEDLKIYLKRTYTEINLDKIESLIKDKKIDPANIINAEQLFKVGLIKKMDEKIKLLGKGDLNKEKDLKKAIMYLDGVQGASL